MNDTQVLVLLVVLAAACLAVALVGLSRARKKSPVPLPPAKPNAYSGRREALRQNLRLKVMYDEAKIDRLIELERDELRRKGRHAEALEDLMERAIARWESDNAGTAPLY
jgi:hypothetical protein